MMGEGRYFLNREIDVPPYFRHATTVLLAAGGFGLQKRKNTRGALIPPDMRRFFIGSRPVHPGIIGWNSVVCLRPSPFFTRTTNAPLFLPSLRPLHVCDS